VRSISLVPKAAIILLLSLLIPNYSFAGGLQQQVCNLGADYFLGIERLLRRDSSPRRRRARTSQRR
jgi:hypothetical protein